MLKDDVLSILESYCGESISGSLVAIKLHITRAAVWKAVKALKEDGYIIEAVQNKGYCLIQQNDRISIAGIHRLLNTQRLGEKIILLKTVDSTNEYIKKAAQSGAENGFTVIAEQQTSGKGRQGRIFYSPHRSGIYMTVLLRPELSAEDAAFITIAAAVAVAQAIEQVAGFNPQIKWINDIFYNGKKLCGILTEASLECESGRVQYIAAGIGINMSAAEINLPAELKETATSIFDITGYEVSRNELIANILNEFECCLNMLKSDRKYILEQYKKRLFILGKKIVLHTHSGSETVTAVDIESNAHLIVKRDDGTRMSVSSGEVSIILK